MKKSKVFLSSLIISSSTLTASAEHDSPEWVVHREYPGPFHLGDENISSWASLVGPCMDVTFPAVQSGGKVQFSYEPYGVENAYLELDDGRRFSLAPQVVQSGTRPNYWGTREYIIIDVLQSSGSMSGKVCSDFLDPTDLDDLMLQNLATLGLSIEQPLPGNSSNPKTISPISEILNKEQSLGDVADVPEQAEQAEQADLQLCDEAYWANNWHAAYTNCSVAASVGNNIAQSYLGWLYYNGLGVIINKERAAQLYTLAAKQGNVNAQLNLGAMYLTGDGVEKNLEDAFQLTMDAANQSSPTGQHNLASMYFNGNGVSRNYAEAVRWWKLAIQNGYSGATRLSEAENFAQAESPEMRDGYRSCLRKIEIDYSRQVKNSYDEVVRAYGLQSTTYEGFDGTGDRARQLNFGNNALFTVYIVAIEERYSGRNIDTINTLSGFTYCVLDKKSGALLGVEYKLEY